MRIETQAVQPPQGAANSKAMRRDKKLQRLILLHVRDGKEPTELNSYPEAERVYNSALLINNNYVEGEAIRGASGTYVSVVMRDLTSKGHDFLEPVHNFL